jgi:myosin heavy subunit
MVQALHYVTSHALMSVSSLPQMPKGTDSSWVEKLYNKCTKWKHFSKARFGTTAFLIHHFADNVTYQSDGFLEKNRDTVLEDQINVIKNGQVSYFYTLMCGD